MLMPILLTLVAASIACAGEPPTHDNLAGKPALTAAAADLKRTSVVATYEHPMIEGQSIMWCSTLQLAWNEMSQAMGGPLKTSATGAGAAMVTSLNASTASKTDLDESSYVAMAGFGKDDILKQIRDALQTRFKGAASPKLLPPSVGSDELFAYAYLFKNLEFADPFIRRTYPLEFGGSKVAAFGLWSDDRVKNWSQLAKQVSILSYTSPTQWTVELKSKATEDRLIIARLDKGKTLAETVTAALGAGKDQKPATMDHNDKLVVPLLNFDITRIFNELHGVPLQGTKSSGPVLDAVQNIRFRLDERGAVLKSEAGLKAGAAMPPKSRDMICDGPFLIVMTRATAARPYFAVWVDNPEILVAFQNK